MDIVPCGRGHFYDRSLHHFCPQCAAEDRAAENENAAMRQFAQYGTPQILYTKKDCTVFSLDGRYVLKKMIGSQLAAGKKENAILRELQDEAHTVTLVESAETENSVYILERYCTPLPEYIRSCEIHWQDIWQIASDLCDDLLYLHGKGYYHLDVHPKNIYINEAGHAVLGDFGNAQPLQNASAEKLEAVTPRYVYPAYFMVEHNQLQISERWDLHSLCMVLYGLLNEGKLPWMSESPEYAAFRLYTSSRIQVPKDDALLLLVVDVLRRQVPGITAFRNRLDRINPARQAQKTPFLARLFGKKQEASAVPPYFSRVYRYPSLNPTDADNSIKAEDVVECGFDSDAAAHFLQIDPFRYIIRTPDSASQGFSAADFGGPAFGGASDWRAPGGSGDWGVQKAPRPVGSGDSGWSGSSGAYFRQPRSAPAAPHSTFDADDVACTMAVEQAAPRSAFDADDVAYSMPVVAPASPHPVFDADDVAYTMAVMAQNEPTEKPALSEVSFSAVCEKGARRDTSICIDVLMYEQAFRAEVDRVLNDLENGQEKRSGFMKAAFGTMVAVELTSPDIPLEDNRCEMPWQGKFLDFSFFADIPSDYARRQVRFTASVFFNDIPATRLKFIVNCTDGEKQEPQMMRTDITSAFISYASQDRTRVASLVQGMQTIRPDLNIFLDVDSLRTGELWEEALFREIDRRDCLFLCWSRNAALSKWVDAEWKHAMQTKGENSIIPAPLEPPELCPPPPELNRMNFNNRLLYLIQAGNQR